MTKPSVVCDAHTAMPSLEGRRAAITGGTTGIGRAIAVLLASEGAKGCCQTKCTIQKGVQARGAACLVLASPLAHSATSTRRPR